MNFRKILFSLTLLAFTGSCQKEKLPKGVLSKEELSALMVNIYLAEARLSVAMVPRDSADKLFKPFQAKLLKDRGISDSTMSITYQYYVQHPQELEQIYDSVIDTLALREQRSKPTESEKKVE